MPDFVEIVIIATDLASKKIDQAAQSINSKLDSIGDSSGKAKKGFDDLDRSVTKTGDSFSTAKRKVGDYDVEVTRTSASHARAVSNVQALGTSLGHLSTGFGDASRAAMGLGKAHASVELSSDRHRVSLLRFIGSLGRFAAALERGTKSLIERALGFRVFGQNADNADKKTASFTRGLGNLGRGLGKVGVGLSSVRFIFVSLIGLLGVVSFGIYGVSGAVTALTGGVLALGSALSTLSAAAVLIPAAIGAIGGAIAAVMTIFAPAAKGILGFVQQAGKEAGAAPTGGGGGGNRDAVQNAEQQVQQARADGARNVARAEEDLRRTRRDNALEIRGLEQDVGDARRTAVQQIFDAEIRLRDLRRQNAQDQQQLELSLADAKASAEAERLRGGAQQGLANSLVVEAQTDLDRFKQDAQEKERAAAVDLANTQIEQINNVRDAEERLRIGRIHAAEQNRDAQQRVADAQRDMARSIADAQNALASAQRATNAETSQAQQLYEQLSPLQQQIANEILAIKNRWNELTAAVRQDFLEEVLHWLDLISANLPHLADLVGKFGEALIRVSEDARAAFSDTSFTDALNRVLLDGAKNIRPVADGFIDLGKAIVRVTDAGRPFTDWVAHLIRQWGAYIDRSAKVNAANGDLARFFNHARQTFTIVGHIIRDLAIALFNIGKIGFPHGVGLLHDFETLAKRARQFTESLKGRNAIKAYFQDAIPVTREIGRFVAALFKMLAGQGRDSIRGGRNSGLAQFFRSLRTEALPAIDKIVRSFVRLGPTIQEFLGEFAKFLPVILAVNGPIGQMLGFLTQVFKLINGLPGPLKDVIATLLVLALTFRKFGLLTVGLRLVLLGVIEVLIFLVTTVVPAVIAGLGTVVTAIGLWPLLIIAALVLIVVLIVTHWDQVRAATLRSWHHISEFLGKAWDKIKELARAAFSFIVDFIKDHWQDILVFLAGGFLLLILKWTGLWGKIKDLLGDAWDWIKRTFRNGLNTLVDFIQDIGPRIRSAFAAIWKGVRNTAAEALNGLIGVVENIINKLIDGINWVLDKIGVDPIGEVHLGRVGQQGSGSNTINDKSTSAARPGFAEGGIAGMNGPPGIYQAVPGGMYRFVEAGHPEAIVPLDPNKRDRALQIMAEVLRRLGFGPGFLDGNKMLELIAVSRARAHDLLPDRSVLGFAGGGIAGGTTTDPIAIRALKEMVRIDRLNLPYVWGGGHQSSPAPKNGPFDCSGFVSEVLQTAGVLGPTMVAQAFMGYGSPGQGILQVIANSGHVYMSALGKYFGTSTYNPRGGPGLLPYGIRSGFAVRHVPGAEGIELHGSALSSLLRGAGGAISSVYHAGNNVFDSLLGVKDWITDHLPHIPNIGGRGFFGKMAGDVLRFARDKIIGGLADKVPFFQEGGIVQGSIGQAVPAVVHAGEWILNRSQQMRLAALLGGWERARDLLFQNAVPSRGPFAGGGIVGTRLSSAGGGGLGSQVTVGPIYTSTPTIDMDYILRVAELRAAGGSV